MVKRTVIAAIILLLFSVLQIAVASEFSVDARVDRTDIGFGESFSLVVTVSQSLVNGRSQRLSLPNIERIPGFDIVSTRSGQSTRFINGVGETSSQVFYELVPQKPGKIVIPAFSISDPMGETHSTKPIEVNVAEPARVSEETPENAEDAPKRNTGFNLFRVLIIAGVFLGALVGILFVISSLTGNKDVSGGDSSFDNNVEDAQIVQEIDANGAFESIKESRPAKKIDFNSEILKLKLDFPEADRHFYKKYFDIFKASIITSNSNISSDMTADEMFHRVVNYCGSELIAAACKRIGNDLEMVLYANRSPLRNFSAIDEDAREIISAISE